MALSHAAVLCPSDDAKGEKKAVRSNKAEESDSGVEDGRVAEDAGTIPGDENDRDDGTWGRCFRVPGKIECVGKFAFLFYLIFLSG